MTRPRRARLIFASVRAGAGRVSLLALAVLLAAGAVAQPAPDAARAGPGYPKVYDSNKPFEPKDIAGIWTPNGAGYGGGGRCRDCGDRGFSLEFPVFTAAGQAAFDA
ncbi:MAG TPA: hypothetical protein VMV37_00500, partial [Gammaproteobacteria bacterium]|nr:hypothetical protein [Gammaproteobacteria bacterium]